MFDFNDRKTFQERGSMWHVEHGQSVTLRRGKNQVLIDQALLRNFSFLINH